MSLPAALSSPSQLWPVIVLNDEPAVGEQLRARARARAKRDRLEHGKRIIGEAAPALFSTVPPDAPIELSPAELEALLTRLSREDPIASRGWQSLFRSVLVQATKRGWYRGPLPTAIVRLRPLGSPITPANFAVATQIDDLRTAFLLSVPTLALEKPDVHAGAILTSAVLRGGLLSVRHLVSLACMQPLSIQSFGAWHWLDLESVGAGTQMQGHRGGATRRWLPDPVTASLLLRWRANHSAKTLVGDSESLSQQQIQQSIWRLIRPILGDCGAGIVPAIGSLTALIKATELALRLHLAPVLVNFARGALQSWSVPAHAWLRLISGRSAGPLQQCRADQQRPRPTAATVASEPEPSAALPSRRAAQYGVIRLSLKILRDAEDRRALARKQLQQVLDEGKSELTPIASILLRWIIARMSREGGWLRPSSVERYVVAFGRPLIDFFGDRHPTSLVAEDWMDIWESIRDSGETAAEMTLRGHLCIQLHGWLVTQGIAPPVDVAEKLDVGDKGSDGVDANLVTPDEYCAALVLLHKATTDGEPYGPAAELVLRTGFRFGLRLSEIFALRVGDIRHFRDGFDIVIRGGKSANARRLLPSAVVPRIGDVDAILAATSNRPADTWFLTEPGHAAEPVGQEAVIALAVWALRTVSGDPTLHLHHLRHSHVTFMSFVLSPAAQLGSRFPGEREKPARVTAIETRVRELRCAMLASEHPTRRSAFAVAVEAGHASPAVGFFSYNHLVDVALYAALRHDLERHLTPTLLAALLDMPKQHVPVFRQRKSVDSDAELIPLRILSTHRSLRKLVEPSWSDYPAVETPVRTRCRNIARALNELHNGQTIENTGARYGFPIASLEAWYRDVRVLLSVTGSRGGKVTGSRPAEARKHLLPVNLSGEDWCLAERTLEQLLDLLQNGLSDAALESLRIGLTQGAGGHADVWFRSPEKAMAFLGFLQTLGVSTEQLRLAYYPRASRNPDSATADRNAWANAIGVDPATLRPVNNKTSHAGSKIGVLGVQVAPPQLGTRSEASDVLDTQRPAGGHSVDVEAVTGTADCRIGSVGFWMGLRLGTALNGIVGTALGPQFVESPE